MRHEGTRGLMDQDQAVYLPVEAYGDLPRPSRSVGWFRRLCQGFVRPLVEHRRVSLVWIVCASLLSFLVGEQCASLLSGPLSTLWSSVSVVGVLLMGVLLGSVYLWSASSATETLGMGAERALPAVQASLHTLLAALPSRTVLGMVLGPTVGLLVWWLPLGLEPVAHRAVAIVGLMLVYWMTEALDHGLTALLGCLLFWLLHVAPPAVAFSGFTTPTPWFMLGGLLIGQAAAQTGLAKRLGYYAVYAARGSPTRLLLGFSILVFVLSLLLSATAQVATLAPVAIGIVAALGLPSHSNMAKGLFLVLSYVGATCSKMILSSGPTVLAWGIMEKQAGVHVLWSQWFLAFLPLAIPTILASWLTVRWLYPPETAAQLPDHASWQDMVRSLEPWSQDERKALGWLLLAIVLWATDFWHHVSPAAIGVGIGVILTLPGLGVLDVKAVKAVNFLLIVFAGGVISMANVLTETHALTTLAALLGTWHDALLSNAWRATLTLYWGGFLYHFLVGSEFTMVSTLLPVLLHVAATQGYNLAAMGMLWVFAGGGKLFVYQNGALILGYSYGFFQAKDLLKVGAVLTVVEGLLILLLVPVYWPLIGLPWRQESQAALPGATPQLARGVYVPGQAELSRPWVSGAHLEVTWAQLETRPGQFDWRVIEQHPTVLQAVRTGKPFGLQIRLQGTAGKPAVPAWIPVPQIEVAAEPGKPRTWPAVWTKEFQTAFPRFVTALAHRYDGDPRLAYVVMTEGTAIPYMANPKRWDTAGYSAAAYSQAYQQIYQAYLQAFHRTPLVAAISRFGQESKQALNSGPEGQALRALLDFVGRHGLHFLVPEVYTRQPAKSIYVKDEMLVPAVRQYAGRSHLLVQLDPREQRGRPVGEQTLQGVQALWPEVPVRAVLLTR